MERPPRNPNIHQQHQQRPEHHQGNTGLHGLGTKAFYGRYRLDEMDLLALTIEALN